MVNTGPQPRALPNVASPITRWRSSPSRQRCAAAANWRLVAEAKAKTSDPAIISGARRKLEERSARSTQEEKLEAVGACLPAAPSPAYIAKTGDVGMQNLDLLERFNQLWRDAEKLRDFSVTAEDKVKNPIFFAASLNARDRLLRTALDVVREIHDLKRMEQFYQSVIDEVGKASPETAQAIMERLARLNERDGITFNARI
jgi:hypothetical protein